MAQLTPIYPRNLKEPNIGSRFGDAWPTSIQRTRAGYVQTTSHVDEALYRWALNYFNVPKSEWETLRAFIDARKGPGEFFYMPSMVKDTTLTSAYSSGNDIDVAELSYFSATDNAHGNKLVVYDPATGNYDGQTVASLSASSGAGTITLDGALASAMGEGSYVEVAVKALFNFDEFNRGLGKVYIAAFDIAVEEVREES